MGQATQAADLFSDSFSREFVQTAKLASDTTIGGYAIYRGGQEWEVVSGSVDANNLQVKIGRVRLWTAVGQDFLADMYLTNNLTQNGNAYYVSDICAGPHLAKSDKSGRNVDNCMTLDAHSVAQGSGALTTLRLTIRNSKQGSRLYQISMLVSLAPLGFPNTGVSDWTPASVAADAEKKKLIDKVSQWAQLLQDGVDKAMAYSKPQNAFDDVPPLRSLLPASDSSKAVAAN
ncbi:hypothetical protein [Rhodoferax sp.]|uniref:hypothetical protein n=1 Tax=Rhodoferax sp. TaxID=50421 RepID=UPI00374D3359